MILTRVNMKGFKNFKDEITYKFDKINLIRGENGTGKSTLAIDSLLFAVFGYSSQTLEKLATRSLKNKEYRVRIEVIDGTKKITVDRYFPTALKISEDGIELKLTNKESQEYLNKLFNSLDWFRKFRMVDSKEGINILEEGKTSIKKTLLSLQEEIFNNKRQDLLFKKRERETYNKDKCIWKHYPSEKRLKVLKNSIDKLTVKDWDLNKEINNQNKIINTISFQIGKVEGQREFYLSKLNKISNLDICPTCTQKVPKELKENVRNDFQVDLENWNKETIPLKNSLTLEKQVLIEVEKIKRINVLKLTKVRELKDKLETAVKQKDFKYTKRDVLIIDKCIKELDNFYGYFITEWIKTLEPIINSVLDKIGFKITFKDDFDIVLHKDGEEYTYKDLSTGQRLILSIAMKLAILIERNEKGLLIADEGLSSLDETNLSYIIKLFNDLPFQLVAIIHRFETEEENINIISL
jgi:AAA15 family ATPase/GTPase